MDFPGILQFFKAKLQCIKLNICSTIKVALQKHIYIPGIWKYISWKKALSNSGNQDFNFRTLFISLFNFNWTKTFYGTAVTRLFLDEKIKGFSPFPKYCLKKLQLKYFLYPEMEQDTRPIPSLVMLNHFEVYMCLLKLF